MTDPDTRALREGGIAHLHLPGIKLTVVEGPDRGRETVARRGIVRIGTAGDNDLALTDPAVSRRHLEVRLRADEVRADVAADGRAAGGGARAGDLRCGDSKVPCAESW